MGHRSWSSCSHRCVLTPSERLRETATRTPPDAARWYPFPLLPLDSPRPFLCRPLVSLSRRPADFRPTRRYCRVGCSPPSLSCSPPPMLSSSAAVYCRAAPSPLRRPLAPFPSPSSFLASWRWKSSGVERRRRKGWIDDGSSPATRWRGVDQTRLVEAFLVFYACLREACHSTTVARD